MKITIRQVSACEIPVLMQWRMEVLHDVFDIPEHELMDSLYKENERYYKATIKRGLHVACFALVNHKIAGCGGMCLYHEMPSPDNPNGKCAYLMNIYTRPAYRGCGIGKKVVEWLICEAQKRNIAKIYLEASEAGRPLYEKLGFVNMHGYMKLENDQDE